MINLLPEYYKKTLKREYQFRRLTVLLLFLSLLGLIAVAAIVPSYILANAKENEIGNLLRNDKDTLSQQEIQTRIKKINAKIKALSSKEQHAVSWYIEEIVSLTPSSVDLTTITYEDSEEGRDMVLMGVATSRLTLDSFVRQLEQQEEFVTVKFPTSNLAQNKDVSFTVTITLK